MNLKNQKGFSLIEVLVSLMLLSLALFGINAMQLFALLETRSAYHFSLATTQMESLRERLLASSDSENSSAIANWNHENAIVLPQGVGVVEGAYPLYHATLYWGDVHQNKCEKIRKGNSGCIALTINL
ncbi:MAG: prepilin-type N-terminal cleavage/methylation domain-containing protein [Gammaproteobacteria bacterium]|nr:prepilin-type N-terminal cleavage/methylation domain-containing protein [Gammaproteobacteria bacterium]